MSKKKLPGEAPKLEPHHYGWIIEFAIDRCAEKIVECQEGIIRLERFPDLPDVNRFGLKKTSEEGIADKQRFLEQYLEIYKLLTNSKDTLNEKLAELWAKEAVEAIRKRH